MKSRFDNQHLIDAKEACRRLQVKPATLYAYVSRGKVRRTRISGRSHLYLASDVDRIAALSAARRGHTAVAAGALQWGEPVLDSKLTSVDESGLAYRGINVQTWLASGAEFETAADHLWSTEEAASWPAPYACRISGDTELAKMVGIVAQLACNNELNFAAARHIELERGRRVIASLAKAVGLGVRSKLPLSQTIAKSLAAEDRAELVRAALLCCLDHELNQSTFGARIAASAGASLIASIGTALYVFSGPRHGMSVDSIDVWLEQLPARNMGRALRQAARRGEHLPGFGHPLYPNGDPRAPPLLDRARVHASGRPKLQKLLRVVDAAKESLGVLPMVDLGLVSVAYALDAPASTGASLFGLGRSAGWIAHILEQRESPKLLRPRARYVGIAAAPVEPA